MPPWETEMTLCFFPVFVGKKDMYSLSTFRKWHLPIPESGLKRKMLPHNYELFLDSHVNMGKYAEPVSVSCIVFNFGYLPKGDHTLATRAESSIQALTVSLSLLKRAGS